MKPNWINGNGTIREAEFCADYLSSHPLLYYSGQFHTLEGPLSEEELRQSLCMLLCCHTQHNLSQKVDAILRAMKMFAYQKPIQAKSHCIYFSNGTYHLAEGLQTEVGYCPIRLNVAYNPQAPRPFLWKRFLEDLLEPEDIVTLQEYLGYCLLPCTKAQKMLMLIGAGGEGKSQIGFVMKAIFGSAMVTNSIQKVEHDRFARADLENKLLMVDDDMDLSAMRKTNYLKTLITAEEPLDVERKGLQSYQTLLFARFLCFGNGALTALYDRTDGFFRRQIILHTKPKLPCRQDDPFLRERLIQEKEGIVLWMLEGLEQLIYNDFQFTLSSQTLENTRFQARQGNNLVLFLESDGYLRYDAAGTASTRGLYECYRRWCDDNAELALSMKSFANELISLAPRYGMEATNNIYLPDSRRCRGYLGADIL